MTNILKYLTLLIISLVGSFYVLLPGKALADCTNPQTTQEQLQCGACNAGGTSDADCPNAAKTSTSTLNSTITNIINIITVVAGIIAVIMLIVGGVRYVTSSGNEQAVTTAKKTILYAIAGLVIIVFAQVISRFVLHTATNSAKTKSGTAVLSLPRLL